MTLHEIKLRRLLETTGSGADAERARSASNSLVEGDKTHHTPKFVQHCVSAITNSADRLKDVQSRKDGSPFGICYAQYKKDKPVLAARHAQGRHHTVKDYEKALATLRESVQARSVQNVRPSSVAYDPAYDKPLDVRSVRFGR